MESIALNELIGKTILSASINKQNDLVILETSTGKIYMHWENWGGDACFLWHVEGSQFLINATIFTAEDTEWEYRDELVENYYMVETMGTKIKTDKGDVSFQTRGEFHGGYIGEIIISYNDDFSFHEREMRPLEDF